MIADVKATVDLIRAELLEERTKSVPLSKCPPEVLSSAIDALNIFYVDYDETPEASILSSKDGEAPGPQWCEARAHDLCAASVYFLLLLAALVILV
jgi:hypothetical protein